MKSSFAKPEREMNDCSSSSFMDSSTSGAVRATLKIKATQTSRHREAKRIVTFSYYVIDENTLQNPRGDASTPTLVTAASSGPGGSSAPRECARRRDAVCRGGS
ncbi:hypothetical protein EYF80_058092 [Liparis tanakae]|uniref:Uncharacterized protein n=1 Tax=Liparis tanakae TaxID=230148 RepID=A0A4Z2ESH0_9TELE|nr:hypothetical protein EYF80_058092 [Liparis tanakae]